MNGRYAATGRRRAFSLIEAAIVLGIVGLVVGGIWVAAATVMDSLRASRASSQTLLLVDKTRRLLGPTFEDYFAQQGAGWHDITAKMIAAGVAPADMVNGSTLETPWGTQFSIWAGQSGLVASGKSVIGITFWGIPASICRKFVANISGSLNDGTVLTQVDVQGTGVGLVQYSTFPISPDTAGLCQSTASTIDYLNFFFFP